MFGHLAVGLDGSPDSAAALDFTLGLAGRLGSVVHGIHVIDSAIVGGSFITDIGGALGVEPLVNLTPQVESLLRDLGTTIREHFQDRAREAGVPFRFHMAQGPVAPTLAAEADTCGLLAVGKRGVNAAAHGDLLGPVTERLLRISRVPVVVSPPEPGAVERILLAYDGSSRSRHALRIAGELARALDVPVTVATVAPGVESAGDPLAEALDHLRPLGLEAEGRMASGHPPVALEHLAGEVGADLLCLGSRGHGRLVEMVLGSTTEAVARRLDIPVLCAP